MRLFINSDKFGCISTMLKKIIGIVLDLHKFLYYLCVFATSDNTIVDIRSSTLF